MFYDAFIFVFFLRRHDLIIRATRTENPLRESATPLGWQPPPPQSAHRAFCEAPAQSMMGDFF